MIERRSLAWLVAYSALIALSRADDVPAFALDVAYLVPIAASGALAAGAAAASRRHVRQAWTLLAVSNLLWLTGEIIWVRYEHHERWDGSGYPRGLVGAAIPVEARIVAVADAWAAMRADRPYAAALSGERARVEILGGRGTQLDPGVADAFLRLVDEGVIGDLAALRRSTVDALGS
jgi:HD-GYP domain-containing protein (c-di-GMP phosphodiesterase class II)